MISTSRTLYSCAEYEDVAVPIEDLVDGDAVTVYPEVSDRGYFDIDYRGSKLVLRSKGFIGYIPLSDKIAIHVRPRTPISNIMHMIWKAGYRLQQVDRYLRGYRIDNTRLSEPEAVYVDAFMSALRNASKAGLLKRYVTRETDAAKRGRLLVSETVRKHRSKGFRHRHTFAVTELTVDNPENRIVKHTSSRIMAYLNASPSSKDQAVANKMAILLDRFAGVHDTEVDSFEVARSARRLLRAIPSSHRWYTPAIWLALLIALRRGVTLDAFGDVRVESVVIDVADVFEGYVRQVVRETDLPAWRGIDVRDGNCEPLHLFRDSNIPAKPDIYLYHDKQRVGVAEVKYKPRLSAADRHQLIAFCEAFGTNRGAFIVPQFGDGQSLIHHGTTRGGVKISIIKVNLAHMDLGVSEKQLCRDLAQAFSMTPE